MARGSQLHNESMKGVGTGHTERLRQRMKTKGRAGRKHHGKRRGK